LGTGDNGLAGEPEKGEDGGYHVIGSLTVVPEAYLKKVFESGSHWPLLWGEQAFCWSPQGRAM
jgi:hypothetical protein